MTRLEKYRTASIFCLIVIAAIQWAARKDLEKRVLAQEQTLDRYFEYQDRLAASLEKHLTNQHGLKLKDRPLTPEEARQMVLPVDLPRK